MDLSIAIPYHGSRYRWTMNTISSVHGYGFAKEIVITIDPPVDPDDRLLSVVRNYKKVRIYKNKERLFVFRNKINSVSLCKNEWCALIDSDNVIGHQYFKPFVRQKIAENVILCPENGFPTLKYGEFLGNDIDLKYATKNIENNNMVMLLNTMNYVFHRETWLQALNEAIRSDYEPLTADSAWINFNCMKNGMILKVVEGMNYNHTIHRGSTYMQHANEGETEYAKIKKMMKCCYEEEVHEEVKNVGNWSLNISKPKRPVRVIEGLLTD